MGIICGKSAKEAPPESPPDEPPEDDFGNPALQFHAKIANVKLSFAKEGRKVFTQHHCRVLFKLVPFFTHSTELELFGDSSAEGKRDFEVDFKIPFRMISRVVLNTILLDEDKKELTNREVPLLDILTGPIHHDYHLVHLGVATLSDQDPARQNFIRLFREPASVSQALGSQGPDHTG